MPLGSQVTRRLKQNLNIHSWIWYLNQVTKPQKNLLMPILWVVTFMQVFGESRYAYLCIMHGSASNFADFQFWPHWPSLNCYNFCSSPSLPMKVVSNWALESSLSFNIKSIQKKKDPLNHFKMAVYKDCHFLLFQKFCHFLQVRWPFCHGVRGHKGVSNKISILRL